MNTEELQQQLFAEIKRKIGENGIAVDEVARLLDISPDSAYRRMRGEKTISLDELHKICKHYNISLDRLMDIQTEGFLFRGNILDKKAYRFDAYMKSMVSAMAYMNNFKKKEFYSMCKDVLIFHQFHIREIAAFKWFFWIKTYYDFPEFAGKKFRFSDYEDELFIMAQKALDFYNQIPSIEVLNSEYMTSIFRQIEFFRDGQVFVSDKDVYILYEALEKLWNHLEKQAELGYKFTYGDPECKPIGELKMYFNEVLILDNNMLAILDNVKMSYVAHTVINYMTTRDVVFNENMYNHIQTQMKRSTLISAVSEKERSKFFHLIREEIIHRKEALKI
jgi:transcriptional regulator with XRE-family HTH domain